MPSSLHGQKGVECAGMAKYVEMRECWWRHLSGGRLVEGSNAHIATHPPSLSGGGQAVEQVIRSEILTIFSSCMKFWCF